MRPRFQIEPEPHHAGDLVFMGAAILFWAAVIFGLVMLIGWYVRKQSTQTVLIDKEPVDIARERYAKGEITKDEFEQLKKDLK